MLLQKFPESIIHVIGIFLAHEVEDSLYDEERSKEYASCKEEVPGIGPAEHKAYRYESYGKIKGREDKVLQDMRPGQRPPASIDGKPQQSKYSYRQGFSQYKEILHRCYEITVDQGSDREEDDARSKAGGSYDGCLFYVLISFTPVVCRLVQE